ARRKEYADFGDHAVHHERIGIQAFDHVRQFGRGEDVHVLLFDDDLLRALDRKVTVPVGHHHAFVQQGGLGLMLTDRAGDTVRRPDLEFRIVLRVGVGGGYHRDVVHRGVAIETLDGGHYALGAP